jgi:hypothetical protein
MELWEVETLKHRATGCNALANAVVTSGVLVPQIAYWIGASTTINLGYTLVTSGFSILIGVYLHQLGARFLRGIRQ